MSAATLIECPQMAEPATAPLPEAGWGDYIRRCAVRDESALAALYDESSKLTYSIALRILQDDADASEVVVDVYKQVWERPPGSMIAAVRRRRGSSCWPAAARSIAGVFARRARRREEAKSCPM